MITVITGTPGAGKTLYVVQNYLQKLVGSFVTGTDGEQVPRTIYTNINGLLLDHELIDERDDGGLNNWHEWAKPGSIIVYDEVQKVWPPRPNGSTVPPYIKALETHRHMGVDFILITQGVMLIDRNLIALAGQHLHIRRIGNSRSCIVYEWDHVSRSLMYSKSITKKIWRYDPKVFKLYKSAELHTKQKRSIPTVLWFLLLAVAAFIYLIPRVMSSMDKSETLEIPQETGNVVSKAVESMNGGMVENRPLTAHEMLVKYTPRFPGVPFSAPAYDHLTQPQAVPKPAACILMRDKCTCYTQRGTQYSTSDYLCRYYVKHGVFLDFEPDEGMGSGPVPIAQQIGR